MKRRNFIRTVPCIGVGLSAGCLGISSTQRKGIDIENQDSNSHHIRVQVVKVSENPDEDHSPEETPDLSQGFVWQWKKEHLNLAADMKVHHEGIITEKGTYWISTSTESDEATRWINKHQGDTDEPLVVVQIQDNSMVSIDYPRA